MANEASILVVDDSLVNLAVLDDMLEEAGFSVILANSGKRGLEMAKKEQPDLILLDVIMPEWDGYETCTHIQQDPQTRQIPVLFLSGLNDTETKVRALEAGGVDYVSKPFQKEELLARVRTHVELSRLRSGLEKEVSRKTQEIRNLLQELKISYQKAQESSVIKSEFLHNISHEFRTPMNIILGSTEELMEDTELDEDQTDMAQSVLNAGHQLMEILTNMLNFSQHFQSELQEEQSSFNVAELVQEIITSFKHRHDADALDLSMRLDEILQQQYFFANRNYLSEALYKLVDNAVKFTHEGGVCIAVRVEEILEDALQLHFSIIDTGIGIDDEHRSRLFQPFTQVDGSSTRNYDGMGLGLALAKTYVERMQGEIGMDPNPDGGSIFWFKMPLNRAQSADQQ